MNKFGPTLNQTNKDNNSNNAASKFGPTTNNNAASKFGPTTATTNDAANKFGPTNNNATNNATASKFGPTNNNNTAAASKFGDTTTKKPDVASAAADTKKDDQPAPQQDTQQQQPPPAEQNDQPANATTTDDADPAGATTTTDDADPDAAAAAAASGDDPAAVAVDADGNPIPQEQPQLDENGNPLPVFLPTDDQHLQQQPVDADGNVLPPQDVLQPQEEEEQQQEPIDPDASLPPALRRLLQTLEPLRPTFAAMLAGDFQIPWPRGATQCPPFDPLSQPTVKKALRLRGDSAMALHSLCITGTHTIVLMGASGLIQQTITVPEMRKIQLIRASKKDPCVLIVDLIDLETQARSTAFYVLLTGFQSGDRAELSVKNSLPGVPLEVLSTPPPVRMPDLQPLLKRMRGAVEEHDRLIAQRTAVLERIRKLQFQSIARSAIAKLNVEAEDAPEQEHVRQSMLNLLVNYVCGYNARARGEHF